MAELVARRPLAGQPPFSANGIEIRQCDDLTAFRLTGGELVAAEGALRLGPRDWLLIGPSVQAPMLAVGRTGLVRDATSGLAFIRVAGPRAADALGLSTLVRDEQGAFTTRLADLRVTVSYRTQPHHDLLLIADRSAADYLWQWLAARIAVTMPAP